MAGGFPAGHSPRKTLSMCWCELVPPDSAPCWENVLFLVSSSRSCPWVTHFLYGAERLGLPWVSGASGPPYFISYSSEPAAPAPSPVEEEVMESSPSLPQHSRCLGDHGTLSREGQPKLKITWEKPVKRPSQRLRAVRSHHSTYIFTLTFLISYLHGL